MCKLEFECKRLIGEDTFLFYHPVQVGNFTLAVWARLRRVKSRSDKKKKAVDTFLRSLDKKRSSDEEESDDDEENERKQHQARKLVRLLKSDEADTGFECRFSFNLYEDGNVIKLEGDTRFQKLAWIKHITSCSLSWDMLAPAVRDVTAIALRQK